MPLNFFSTFRSGPVTRNGTEKRDYLFGTRDDDILNGFGGNDFFFARRGKDTDNMGEGDDIAFLGRGDDIAKIGSGNDTVFGGRGFDTVIADGSVEDYLVATVGSRFWKHTELKKVAEDGTVLEVNKLYSVNAVQFDDFALFLDGRNNNAIARDDIAATDEDTALLINASALLANDKDLDGDEITVVSVSGTSAKGGVVALVDGVITYDPNGQFENLNDGDEATDTFSYTIDDGKGGTDTATVTVKITGVTAAPDVTARINDFH
mgnify:CR=1 FL=1